jgi:hypothetical protein
MGRLGSSVDERRVRRRQRYAAQRLPCVTQAPVVETIPQAPPLPTVGQRLSPPQVDETRLAYNVPEIAVDRSSLVQAAQLQLWAVAPVVEVVLQHYYS